MPQSLNIAICEDEAAETKLLCDILNHSDIKNSYTVFTGADALLASCAIHVSPVYDARNSPLYR